MIHAAAAASPLELSTLHFGSVRCDDPATFLRECVRLEATAGREHVTIWTPDAETLWRRLFVEGGRVLEHDDRACVPVWGSQYMVRAQWGRIHFRDTRSWTAKSADELRAWAFTESAADATLRWHRLTAGALERIGAEHRGTAAGAAHRLWRDEHNDRGAWRYPDDTETGDFARRAYFGGRTTCHHTGLVARAGHVPAKLQARYSLPAAIIPDGFRLWRIDQRSAYPAAMRGPMPWVWSSVVESPVWREDVAHGIVEATVRVGDAAGLLLPLRVRQADGPPRTGWLAAGARARGHWTATVLREAIRLGSSIENVHRAVWWAQSYRPFGDLPDRVYSLAAELDDEPPVKDAVKSLTRRLYGRLGVGRRRYEWMTVSEYLSRTDCAHPRYHIGGHVCVPVTLDEYPEHAQPAWAAEITSRVNVTLHRVERALRAAGLPVYYTDTDSILFAAPGRSAPDLPEDVKRRMGDGLGGWRVDWRGDWALLLGPKWYALSGGRTALAGIPQKLQAEVIALGYGSAYDGGRLIREDKHE